MNQNKLDALASYIVVDFLEREGISPHLRQSLVNEFNQKGLFRSLINFNGDSKPATYSELASQLPKPTQPILKNLLYSQSQISNQKYLLDKQKKYIEDSIQQKYDIFDRRKRRDRLKRINFGYKSHIPPKDFPSEIFTHYWNKLKSIFGHMKKEQDPDDFINGSPVYNLVYDKSGKYIISAADDGFIKIWSTTNGELVNTLIGHDADINATAISECGKYLASCSNHGIVRIWSLETFEPIAVFNDHNGVVCSLNFFKIPLGSKHPGEYKSGLASASDDGTVKIYFMEDFVHNAGAIQQHQKHFTLMIEEVNSQSKGFSSIEFHPEGYMAAGTSGGSIIIWNKLLELDPKDLDKNRIIKNEHLKDCHLTLWNKDGSKLLSASFDGTAKIWPWNSANFDSNKSMKPIFVFEGELGKGGDIKCSAVAWSCNGNYAMTSFCKKNNIRRGEENATLQANIQVYDSRTNTRAHKFDRTYDGGLLENYIFILEPHPFNDSILMSADYDGKVIIWNIEFGIMLNCFIENCSHLGLPLLEAPILDGRFSPDGLNFCIANFYGTITLYGYGDKDMFLTTPTQQFLQKEFLDFEIDSMTFRIIALDGGIDMHLVGKGLLCSADKKEYTKKSIMPEDYFDFDVNEYYQKFVEALERHRHEGKQELEGINSQNCLKALKIRIKELIQHEVRIMSNTVLGSRLWRNKKVSKFGKFQNEQGQLMADESYMNGASQRPGQSLPSSQGIDHIALLRRPIQVETINHELVDRIQNEDSDYEVPSDTERQILTNPLRRGRRRGRRSRAEIEAALLLERINADEQTNQAKNESHLQEMEEETEDISFHRRRNQRRHSRLFIEEEDEKEETKIEEENQGLRRTERRNRPRPNVEPVVQVPAQRRTRGNIEENSSRRLRLITQEEPQRPRATTPASSMQIEEETKESTRGSRGAMLRNLRERHLGEGGRLTRDAMGVPQTIRSTLRNRGVEDETTEEKVCARCGLENAKVKCDEGCSRIFHSGCSKKHGKENDMGTFSCFSCLYQKRKKEKAKGAFVERDWLDVRTEDTKRYLPQVGDLVTFIPQAYEEFVLQHFESLRFSKGELYPFQRLPSLLKDNVCLVKEIKYQFPLVQKKQKNAMFVLMKITMEIVEPEDNKGESFTVTYFQTEESPFIIPREYYLSSIKYLQTLQKETQIFVNHHGKEKLTFLSERIPKEEGIFFESYWHSLVLFDHSEDGGYLTRRTRRGENERTVIHASPWDVIIKDNPPKWTTNTEISEEFIKKVIDEMDKFCAKRIDISEHFVSEVDKKDYPKYLNYVPFEMNVQKVFARLRGHFYRHKEAIASDLDVIRANCYKYNGPEMDISKWAEELVTHLKKIVIGETKTPVSNISPVKTRNQRRKGSHGEEEHHRHEEKVEATKTLFGNVAETRTRSIAKEENIKEEKANMRTERLRARTKTQEMEIQQEIKEVPVPNTREVAGRPSRLRARQEPPQAAAAATEHTEAQEGYKTRLRDRSIVHIHNEYPSTQIIPPKILSREERFMKRLKNRGESVDEKAGVNSSSLDEEKINEQIPEEKVEKAEKNVVVEEKVENKSSRYPARTRNTRSSAEIHSSEGKDSNYEDGDEHEHESEPIKTEKRPTRRANVINSSENSEEKEQAEKRPTRLSHLKTKLLRKTETMRQRQMMTRGNQGNQDEDEEFSDGSLSVGEERKGKNEKGIRSRLRRNKKTYAQFFEENSESDIDSDESEDEIAEFEIPVEAMKDSENSEEVTTEHERNGKERIDKVRVIAEKDEEAPNGEKPQVKRYSTRSRDKLT